MYFFNKINLIVLLLPAEFKFKFIKLWHIKI